ncbi:MAG: roadblock/LC7 domain-containing protein [Thermodesulfobacteriota bacterium]|jgi:predicted regulator of Ras-like GTPase activity (Roadblock/LC7/MglB family)
MVEDGGGIAGTVMGKDGIAVQSYVRISDSYDIETVGIEYVKIVDEIRRVSSMLHLGEVEEISIKANDTAVLFRIINAEYFAAIVLELKENIGKAKYMLRRAVNLLRKEF